MGLNPAKKGRKLCKVYVFYRLWFICNTQVNLIIKEHFILKADTFVFDRNKTSRMTFYNSMTYNRGQITHSLFLNGKVKQVCTASVTSFIFFEVILTESLCQDRLDIWNFTPVPLVKTD